jgi:hypothetical protein
MLDVIRHQIFKPCNLGKPAYFQDARGAYLDGPRDEIVVHGLSWAGTAST